MFFVVDGAAVGRILFFFSSRRRHTRWTGDWSSDVCSSDLPGQPKVALRPTSQGGGESASRATRCPRPPRETGLTRRTGTVPAPRGRKPAMIEARGLTKRFGDKLAVD